MNKRVKQIGAGSKFQRYNLRPVLVAIVIGAVGTFLLTSSRAATSSSSIEAESAATSSQAVVLNDSTAASGKAVRFTAAPPPGTGEVCATYPTLPSTRPVESTTGVPSGTNLTAYTGPRTITAAGTVIDSKIISGDLVINADNVTIKNSRISGSGYYAIDSNATSGVKLLHNEILSGPSGAKYIGVIGKYELICANHIYGFENAISMYDGGSTIQANLIHKLEGADASAHHDGIEVYGGSNTKIWGNNIKMTRPDGTWLTETGAINISDDGGVINNAEINGNWLGGGSFTLYVDDQFGYSISNVKLTNNTWYGGPPRGYAGYGPMLIRNSSTVTANTGNKWETGAAL